MKMLFEGVGTALVTPFLDNGKIDFESLKKLIEIQIDNKIDAVILLGTTGESPTISFKERKKLITFARKLIPKTAKLIVGTGSNDTKTALKYTLQAQNLGADGALIVTPYYNKCTQNGAIAHYNYIAQNSRLPIIVYNVPSRTGFNLLPETMQKLSNTRNIIGIKEANENLDQIDQMLTLSKDKFSVYSGSDKLNQYFYSNGGKGCISVLSNIYPEKAKEHYRLSQIDTNKAEEYAQTLDEFATNLFIDVNPIPAKYVLYKQNKIGYNFRLPLTPTSIKNELALDDTFDLK